MAAGTPVITNLTGDIGLYLKDNSNGFIVNKDIIYSLENIFTKIININKEDKSKMRENARQTAEKYYDYRNYKDKMINFLKK